jgi:hypothetical protein
MTILSTDLPSDLTALEKILNKAIETGEDIISPLVEKIEQEFNCLFGSSGPVDTFAIEHSEYTTFADNKNMLSVAIYYNNINLEPKFDNVPIVGVEIINTFGNDGIKVEVLSDQNNTQKISKMPSDFDSSLWLKQHHIRPPVIR